jgi:hypothetical protein
MYAHRHVTLATGLGGRTRRLPTGLLSLSVVTASCGGATGAARGRAGDAPADRRSEFDSPALLPSWAMTAPAYGRQDWIAHSSLMAELVVEANLHPEDCTLDVTEVLLGSMPRGTGSLRLSETASLAGLLPCKPGDPARGRPIPSSRPHQDPEDDGTVGLEGVWLLVSDGHDYASLSFDSKPISRQEWEAAAATRSARLGSLGLYKSGTAGLSLLDLNLRDRARRVILFYSWQPGRLRILYRPERGRGYRLDYSRGRVESFAHYWDDQQLGLEVRYDTSTGRVLKSSTYRSDLRWGPEQEYGRSGELRSEASFVAGLLHGPARYCPTAGSPCRVLHYDHGLLEPVVHYRGHEKPRIERVKPVVDGTVHFYSGDHSLFGRIVVGMTTEELSKLLRTDFSERGLRLGGYRCDYDFVVEFAQGRVSRAEPMEIYAECEPAER